MNEIDHTNPTLMAAGYNTAVQVRRDARKVGLLYPDDPEMQAVNRKQSRSKAVMTDQQRAKIARLYRDGIDPHDIAALVDRQPRTVCAFLIRAGLRPKPDTGPKGGRPRINGG